MIIDDHINEIELLCKRHDVASLSVFGSVQADKFDTTSDIVFLVIFNHREVKGSFDRYFNLKEDLGGRLVSNQR